MKSLKEQADAAFSTGSHKERMQAYADLARAIAKGEVSVTPALVQEMLDRNATFQRDTASGTSHGHQQVTYNNQFIEVMKVAAVRGQEDAALSAMKALLADDRLDTTASVPAIVKLMKDHPALHTEEQRAGVNALLDQRAAAVDKMDPARILGGAETLASDKQHVLEEKDRFNRSYTDITRQAAASRVKTSGASEQTQQAALDLVDSAFSTGDHKTQTEALKDIQQALSGGKLALTPQLTQKLLDANAEFTHNDKWHNYPGSRGHVQYLYNEQFIETMKSASRAGQPEEAMAGLKALLADDRLDTTHSVPAIVELMKENASLRAERQRTEVNALLDQRAAAVDKKDPARILGGAETLASDKGHVLETKEKFNKSYSTLASAPAASGGVFDSRPSFTEYS